MEAGILGILNPVGPLGPLQAMGWPIPSILGLNNVELPVKSESHGGVANVGACAIHDDRVEAVETEDCQEITRLDKIGVHGHFLRLTFL
jgi:hypothetical protein